MIHWRRLILDKQSVAIQQNLAKSGIKVSKNKEIIALIAYLQRLGKDIKTNPQQVAAK
jgi:cytochrome c oxidase cbb3-type subunit I/II